MYFFFSRNWFVFQLYMICTFIFLFNRIFFGSLSDTSRPRQQSYHRPTSTEIDSDICLLQICPLYTNSVTSLEWTGRYCNDAYLHRYYQIRMYRRAFACVFVLLWWTWRMCWSDVNRAQIITHTRSGKWHKQRDIIEKKKNKKRFSKNRSSF